MGVLVSARATPRTSIACVASIRPSGGGEQMVSRRRMADHAAVGLAALGLLGQPAAWAVDTSAFEAKAAKYKAEREKRELTKPVAKPLASKAELDKQRDYTKTKLIRECAGSLKAGKNCGPGYTSYKSKKYFEFEGGDV